MFKSNARQKNAKLKYAILPVIILFLCLNPVILKVCYSLQA